MPARCFPTLAFALLVAALGAMPAAEQAPPSETPNTQEKQDAAAHPATDTKAKALKQALGNGKLLTVDQGALHWRTADTSFTIDKIVNKRRAAVHTAIGSVEVDRGLLTQAEPAALQAFAALVKQVEAAKLPQPEGDAQVSGFRFDYSLLMGYRLRSSKHLVIPEAILSKQSVDTDRQADIAAAEAAAKALQAAIPKDQFTTIARRAIDEVIEQATKPQPEKLDGDEVTPHFARQIIRHDWLTTVLDKEGKLKDVIAAFSQAVAQLDKQTPKLLYTADTAQLAQYTTPFATTGWLLKTDKRTILATVPPIPEYHWPSASLIPKLLTIMDLPAGSDPLADPSSLMQTTAARLIHGNDILASWSEAGFETGPSWRRYFPDSGNGLAAQIVSNYMPPHLVLRDLAGDIYRIITPHGHVDAPRDAAVDATAFFTQAAKSLPDAAHLDLIGQYLFKYVYDSPDSANPQLVGNRTDNGDIHQTAAETLATAAGGRCRGDCDDLSEFYQHIVSLQGKTAHVISLPAHAALAWAEQRGDQWHTFVMQTGPTLEFTDKTLQNSLAKAYKRFDASDTFDPNGLGLLLRFSGENTRSGWRLSYRIFSEPDYAKTMIDVQRDWHFQTYLEGIKKMEALIASGDDDTANYRELAGLFNFTAQYSKAADYMEEAIKRTSEDTSKLFESSEWTHHLLRAERDEDAMRLVDDILNVQLPPLKEKLGLSAVQYGLQLAGFLISEDSPDMAARVLAATADEQIGAWIRTLGTWTQEKYNERVWEHNREVRIYRRMMSWYARLGIQLCNKLGPKGMMASERYQKIYQRCQLHLDQLRFFEVDEGWKLAQAYADAGSLYRAAYGDAQLLDMLDAVASPKVGSSIEPAVHRKRIGSLMQVRQDLPWIRVSPSFYVDILHDYQEEHKSVPAELAKRLSTELQRASAEANALGIDGPFLHQQIHTGQVILAMLQEDSDSLRQLLRTVKTQNDKRLRDATAETLGSWAGYCSSTWFDQVLQLWVEELDYKPKYYLIAWEAKKAKAFDRALQAAALAAKRFADDAAFVNEHRFMQELVSKRQAEAKALKSGAGNEAQ